MDNEFAELVSTNLPELTKVQTVVNICDISSDAPLDGPDYEAFLVEGDPDPVEIDVDDERQVATINYTSGTTGLPKGVMYHHRGAYLNAIGEQLEFGTSAKSKYLWTLPMFSLQRLVFHLGHHGHGRHPCVPAQSRAGRNLQNHRRGRSHPSVRGTHHFDRHVDLCHRA